MIGRRDIRMGIALCAYNEADYIEYCLRSIYDFAHVIGISVNTGVPWGGKPQPIDDTYDKIRSFPDPDNKIRIVAGEWASEMDQRIETVELLRPEANYLMTVDADEVYSREDLAKLKRFVALRPFIGQFRVRMKTYWKINPFRVIDPPEPYKRYLISKLRDTTRLISFSRTNEKWRCMIPRDVAVCHHFSYARTDERIRQKLDNTSHKSELVEDWYENVWVRWDNDPEIENLHPTHPEEFKRAICVEIEDLPEVMRVHPYAGFKED